MPDFTDLSSVRAFVKSGKPEWMSDAEFIRIGSILEKLTQANSLSEEHRKSLNELNKEKGEVSDLKKKAMMQLKIINDLLNDPSTIDRIEEYDDTFAPGNLANLRKVAQILSASKN